MRELTYLTGGRVVAGLLDEIGQIAVERQDAHLVAAALSCAAVVDDPESGLAAPRAFGCMMKLLDELHEHQVIDDV